MNNHDATDFSSAVWNKNHPYHSLAQELLGAYNQAAKGKGAERHANSRPFERQRIQSISDGVGSVDGLTYQTCKKMQEAAGLEHEAALRERHGAIVYAAAANIWEARNR